MREFTVSEHDRINLKKDHSSVVRTLRDHFEEHPKDFGLKPLVDLEQRWNESGKAKAIFKLLQRDGLAEITRDRDEFFTFADYEDEMFCPKAHSDIDPETLKKDRKRELARFNRNKVWYHTLVVKGCELDSIGGFVGKDFYGSGYDTDFYNTAIEEVSKNFPEYISDAQSVFPS